MSRVAALGFLVVLSAAAPAAAGGLSPADADAAATAFRLAYGSDVDIQFDSDGRGARFLAGFRTEPLAGDPTEAAWRFLEREALILGLTDARATLRVEGTYEWSGWTAVRFRQVAFGRPVLGRGFVVLADDRGRVYQVAGSIVDVSTIAAGELLSLADAAAALRRVVSTAKVTMLEPVIFADGSTVRFAFRAEVENGGPFERFEVMQDAISGMPLAARNMFKRAQANVYEINPLTTPTLTEVTLGGLVSTTELSGDRADSYACSGGYCDSVIRRAVPDIDGNYFYTPVEPSLTDPFAEVQAYYETNKLNHYLEDNWGFLWECGGSNVMTVAVNLGIANAMFGDVNGDRCGDAILGEGSEVDFSYDSDVIFHEFGHGVFGQVSIVDGWGFDALGPDFTGGGLGEGTADYTAVTVNNDAHLGEYMATDPSAASGEVGLREADNTTTCPRNLVGEEHYDGKIWLGTLWEIRVALGAAKTDALMLATLMALSESAGFDEAGRGLISAATRLVGTGVLAAGDDTVVETITTGRGLPGCERIVDLYDPVTGERFAGTAFSMGLDDMGGWASEMASGIQFRIRTPVTAFRVSLEIRPATVMATNAYDVYMRVGAPVHFVRSGWEWSIDLYDRVLTGNPDGMTMATWSTPPLVPGSDYYFTFVHRNPTAVLMGFTATVAVTEPEPDAGDGGTDTAEVVEDVPAEIPAEVVEDVPAETPADTVEPDVTADAGDDVGADVPAEVTIGGGGCGCRTVPASGGLLFLAFLLGAALLRRRS
jgi:MYXO-CTERM domain-containing protein